MPSTLSLPSRQSRSCWMPGCSRSACSCYPTSGTSSGGAVPSSSLNSLKPSRVARRARRGRCACSGSSRPDARRLPHSGRLQRGGTGARGGARRDAFGSSSSAALRTSSAPSNRRWRHIARQRGLLKPWRRVPPPLPLPGGEGKGGEGEGGGEIASLADPRDPPSYPVPTGGFILFFQYI